MMDLRDKLDILNVHALALGVEIDGCGCCGSPTAEDVITKEYSPDIHLGNSDPHLLLMAEHIRATPLKTLDLEI